MLRGFRWQMVAFVMAIILFLIGFAYRNSVQPTPQPTQTPTVTIPNTESPPTLTPEPTQQEFPTPFPETPIPKNSTSESASPVYREGMIGNVQRLNPIFAHLNPVDNDITSLIFEGLITTNDFGEPILNLASDYVISNDGLEYVFTLRTDILWQDGQPFSADDVIYTMSLLSSQDYADYSPTAQFWKTVETQKLSDTLVRFRLTQPLGSFTSFLTVGILPEHALRGTDVSQLASHPFNLSPIGTGAYQLSTLRSNSGDRVDEIHLQFAPVYTQRINDQTPYAYRNLIISLYDNPSDAVQAYTSGQLNALANVTSRTELRFLPDSRIYTQVEPDVAMLLFNWQADDRNVFADRRVRQALSLGLNQAEIIERYLATDSTPADSPLIPGSWAYRPNPIWTTFDSAQALQLLESANIEPLEPVSDTEVEQSVDIGSLYTFSIMVQNIDPFPAIAGDIANLWRQLGFDVSVDAVDSETYQARLQTSDFQVTIASLSIGGDPDVYRYWHPGQHEDGQNYGVVANNEVAELLELARRDNNGINRTTLYHQFQERFAEQAIAIPLYYPLYTFVAQDSIVGIKLGYMGTSADRFRTISQWKPETIETG
jgi:peptide/nickel transport system substrate-binding protein